MSRSETQSQSTASPSQHSVRILRSPRTRAMLRLTRTLLSIALLALAYWALEHWIHYGTLTGHPEVHADSEETPASPTTLSFKPEKWASIKIDQSICTMRTLQPRVSVPGRIEYEPQRLLELKSPVTAVIRKIHTQQGSRVEAGSPLVEIDSEEIGLARVNLRNHREEQQLRQQELDRVEQIASSIQELQTLFETGLTAAEIEQKFMDKPLGLHREILLKTYSQYLLARNLVANLKDMENSGALSTRTVLERKSQFEVAQSAFLTAREQAIYDSQKNVREAQVALKWATDLTAVSVQKLAALAGNFSTSAIDTGNREHLTEMTLHAPFAGVIAESFVQAGTRINALDSMFTLGDATRLRISIEVRESQWNALQVRSGESLRFSTPALPDQKFDCQVSFVSSTVSHETRAVPIIAAVENHRSLLRPGMLVWVEIPAGEPINVLTVPHSALQTHDGKKFVFVPAGERSFKRQDVTTGREDENFTEILSGLSAENAVVTTGSFILKSELLLEPE